MGNMVAAVLLDTRSIQKYVFGCNELKTNVGASYIVDKIFEELLAEKILKKYRQGENLELDWKNNKTIKMAEHQEVEYEIAYIGGGNMLLLVRLVGKPMGENLQRCREIVAEWSKAVLLSAPGLKTGSAVGELDISREGFKVSLDKLYKSLKENQNTVLPNVDLPYVGFTMECGVSGKTADTYDYSGKNKRMVSAEVKAKINAYNSVAKNLQEELKRRYPDKKLNFANEFQKMGYKDGESYLSIIHIDGNNMGVKFSCCEDIQERKSLSLKMQENVEKAFGKLLDKIVDEYDSYKEFLKLEEDDNVQTLPFRPIIIGGDDITFVCPGRLGIELAKYFIEEVGKYPLLNEEQHKRFTELVNANLSAGSTAKKLNKNLSCCGGMAIVPAKYPFFRAYELAEQLCSLAKTKSRQNDDSWLDFAILHGEMTPELDQMRRQEYKNSLGYNLHSGPYQVVSDDMVNSLDALIALSYRLTASTGKIKITDKKVAQNKVKKLREVLCGDQHGVTIFLEHAEDVKDILREETGKDVVTAADFWQTKTGENVKSTKFIDAIEIIDFLPIN